MYVLYYTNDAKNDYKKIKQSNLKDSCLGLLRMIEKNPFQNPPPYKKLRGVYLGLYSRKINLKHRLFYEVDEKNKRVKIIRMRSHYGDN